MDRFALIAAGAALALHGLVELASLLSFRAPAGSRPAAMPKFIFQPLQDHLKAIFTKAGTRDRVSLLSRALGTRRAAPLT